jgi:regulator of sigma E protease
VPIHNRFFYAVGHAFARTGEIVVFTAQGFFQIIRGEMSPEALGGPLAIGYAAGVAAEQGLAQYLWLMALLSINIGLLNFLPIPILDGGRLMFITIELFKRRPPSARARAVASYVGIVLVVLLVAVALKNDIVRFLLPR